MPEAGKRYVFVYVGTGSISLQTIRQILPKVFAKDGNLRCLVGAQSITKTERLGAVELHPYIPAQSVLRHCDWTICHGGQNTIIQSLRADVPLIIFPGPIFERRYNAQKVADAGAGLMGELADFNPSWLAAALARQTECADHAAALGTQIRSYGGPPDAVETMAAWAG